MKLCHSPFFWLGLLYFFTAKGHLEIIDTEYSLRTAVAIIEHGSMLIEPPNSSVLLNTPVIESDGKIYSQSVSYTHLRAHETSLHLVCRLLLEKKKSTQTYVRG